MLGMTYVLERVKLEKKNNTLFLRDAFKLRMSGLISWVLVVVYSAFVIGLGRGKPLKVVSTEVKLSSEFKNLRIQNVGKWSLANPSGYKKRTSPNLRE